jgi:hypothetical protein
MEHSEIMRNLVLNRAYKDYPEGTEFELISEFYKNGEVNILETPVYVVKYDNITLKINSEYLDELPETNLNEIPKRVFTDEELKRIKQLQNNLYAAQRQKETIQRGIEKIERKLNYFINRCDHYFKADPDDPEFLECQICGKSKFI